MVKVSQVEVQYIEEVGPEYLLRGAQYTLEMINFTMFIAEEAEQAACSGMSLAVQGDCLHLAQRMSDEVVGAGNSKIWEIIVMYALGFSPTWVSFYCFMLFTNLYIDWLRKDLVAAWAKKGVYTREDMAKIGGRSTIWTEENDVDKLHAYSMDNQMRKLEDIAGANVDYFSKIIKNMDEKP